MVVRLGSFRRKSDGRWVKRFKCKDCGRGFSHATRGDCYRQNKRHLNHKLLKLFSSGLTQRRLALIFGISRTTVVRKMLFLKSRAEPHVRGINQLTPMIDIVEFDDMESFEHTKCKPLSMLIAVEHATRRIIDLEVARMPAKGPLAKIALKKYGKRVDERAQARTQLFIRIKARINRNGILKSDENPHYPKAVRKHFPRCEHLRYKGRRGCVTGQGELKAGGFDPLFTFNHTAAMFRANVSRLFRRTWNTTKRADRLADHMMIYAHFHNTHLI